jgi:hypothetical protein
MRIAAHGVRLTLPRGWTGNVESLGGDRSLAYLEAANFPLHGKPPPEQTPANGLTVALSESKTRRGLRHPVHRLRPSDHVALTTRDFLPTTSPRVPANRAVAVYAFKMRRRFFTVEADVAQRTPRRGALRRINRLLRTLVIRSAR